jgi:hypothetical protein
MKLEFWSHTYENEDVAFICQADGKYESDEIVSPILGERFTLAAEDYYEFDGTFEEGCLFLESLGFKYKGKADNSAIPWRK